MEGVKRAKRLPMLATIRRRASQAQRRALLESASALLTEEGPKGLTLRTLATRVGASTTAVYTHFGSKDELLEALYTEGLERLGATLRRARGASPLEELAAIALAYRRFA